MVRKTIIFNDLDPNNMIQNKIFSIIALAMLTITAASCGDETNSYQNITPASGAKIKFIHAAPDVVGIEIYVNDKKFSGVATSPPAAPALLMYGNAFPSTAEYATLPAGKVKVGVVIPSLNVTALATDINVEEGKYYSVFATGIAPNYTPFVLEDKIPAPAGKSIFVRVVNLIPNSISADFTVNGQVIATDVPYKNADAAFVAVPIDFAAGTISIPFAYKVLGGLTPLVSSTLTIAGFFPGRAVTIYLRGTLTTDAKNPTKYTPTGTVYINK